MKKPKAKRKISLGDDFGPAVVRMNGLTVKTDGNGRVKIEIGDVTVDIVKGNTTSIWRQCYCLYRWDSTIKGACCKADKRSWRYCIQR